VEDRKLEIRDQKSEDGCCGTLNKDFWHRVFGSYIHYENPSNGSDTEIHEP